MRTSQVVQELGATQPEVRSLKSRFARGRTVPILFTPSSRLKRFLGAGYFPKELPPVFVTEPFARYRSSLERAWPAQDLDQWRSVPEPFSLPKAGHARRALAIVNPISEFKIATLISSNWREIAKHIRRSPITEFAPVLDVLGERAVLPANFIEVDRRRARIRANYPRALKSDISRFYPSIYTHSVAWALHGKDWAKRNVNKPALNNSLGGQLDRALRQSQDNQTIGISVGPDSTRIVAEIIGSAIDQELYPGRARKGAVGLRYIDDFLLGVSAGEADATVAARLREALKRFELEINAEKTSADSTGQDERPKWARRLQAFPFNRSNPEVSLRDYFDEVVGLYCMRFDEAIAKYGVKRSRSFAVSDDAVPYYVDRLIHVARLCPGALPAIVQTILERKASGANLDLDYLRHFIVEALSEHGPVGHDFEAVWHLFLARGLALRLKRSELAPVFRMESSPVALVAMDMNQRGLISRGIDQSTWKSAASAEGLKGPMWLLAYEAVRKGWWTGISDAYVRSHPLFGPLLARGVYFYEETRNVRTTSSELRRLLAARVRYRSLFEAIDDYF